MWTFYVELKESGKIISGVNYPNLIHSQGDVPENPPEKNFKQMEISCLMMIKKMKKTQI